MTSVFFNLGRVYGRSYRAKISELLNYSGSSDSSESWLGKLFIINIIAVLVVLLLWRIFMPLPETLYLLALICMLTTVSIQALSYMGPFIASERRARNVESVLPNFYQLLASYLRSGMTPFQALKASSRKEFGILKDELDKATSTALGTQSFTDSLLSMNSRIKSDSLKQSTELMVRGIESGGSLAKLLEESSANLMENRMLHREIIASSKTYTLMVIFAVIIGSPLLLSIATRFNERLIDLSSQIEASVSNVQGVQGGLLVSGGSIDPGFLFAAAFFMVCVTAFVSSFLIGIISKGKEKYGLVYAVVFVPVSAIFFLIFRFFLTSLF